MDTGAKRRLVTFLLLSLLLHLLLLALLSRLPESAPDTVEEQPLVVELIEPEEPAAQGEAKTFDMMEVKEALSDVPASLSPRQAESLKQQETPQPPPQAVPPPRPAERKPTVAKKPPETPPEPEPPPPRRPEKPADREPEKPTIVREPPEKPERDRIVERRVEEAPRELPSVRDLIPSINDIWAMKAPGGSLYRHPDIVQDGIGERQAKVAYDEYLADFKSRVKMNWKVSDDPYMHESTTVLLITINRDGSLGSVEKLKSSGMPGHDTETLFAVRHSFPMRPPPKILLDEGGLLKIQFSFHFLVRNARGAPSPGRSGVGREMQRREDPGCVPPCYRW